MILIDKIKENEKFINNFLGGAFENIKFEIDYLNKSTKEIEHALTCKSKIKIDDCYLYITLYFKRVNFYEYVLFDEVNFFDMVNIEYDICLDNVQEIKKILKIKEYNTLKDTLKTNNSPAKKVFKI